MNALLEKLSKAAGFAWRAARMCGAEQEPVRQIKIVPGRCENFPSNAEYMVADVEWSRSGKQVTALLHGTLTDEAREGKKELRVRVDQAMNGISVSSAKRGQTHLTFFLKIIAEDGRPREQPGPAIPLRQALALATRRVTTFATASARRGLFFAAITSRLTTSGIDAAE